LPTAQHSSAGRGAPPAPPPPREPRKRGDASFYKNAFIVVSSTLAGVILTVLGIYPSLEGKITRVEDKQEAAVKELAGRMGKIEEEQRKLAAWGKDLCRLFGDMEETKFHAQCNKDKGQYDFNTRVCTPAEGEARRFRKPCEP